MQELESAARADVDMSRQAIATIALVIIVPAYCTTVVSWVVVAIAFLALDASPMTVAIACAIVAAINYAGWFVGVHCVVVEMIRYRHSRHTAEDG